ncbi:Vitamin B12 import system permease protein BtuC [Streptomyces microflavus]
MGRKLDILALGDDGAAAVGVSPRLTRSIVVVLAVLLAAVSVTVAGPVGFVGLCAPAVVRLLSTWIPGLVRHHAFIPASALAGVLVVLGADVALRALFGAQAGAEVPTGIVTTCLGALVLRSCSRLPVAGPGRREVDRRRVPVRSPLVFSTARTRECTTGSARSWEALSASGVEFHSYAGGHFFIDENLSSIIQLIVEKSKRGLEKDGVSF